MPTIAPTKRLTVDQGYGRTSRRYRTPEGEEYDSVTSILSAIGKPALINWAAKTERELVIEAAANLWEDVPTGKKMSRPAYVATLAERIGKTKAHQRELTKASEIGTEAHALAEWNLREQLGQKVGPQPRVSDKAQWAFMAFEDWRKAWMVQPRLIEQAVWSTQHRYAGTMDLYGECAAPGIGAIVACTDFKTGKAIYPEAVLQVTAYIRALIEMGHAEPPVYGLIVRFPKVETDPEFETRLITPAEQDASFPVFLAVKALWDWQQAEDAKRRKTA